MAKITKEELLHLAHISGLTLTKEELPGVLSQFEAVLTYAERVLNIEGDAQDPVPKQRNIFRDDAVIKYDAQQLLVRAPEHEENFFVVPRILGNSQDNHE